MSHFLSGVVLGDHIVSEFPFVYLLDFDFWLSHGRFCSTSWSPKDWNQLDLNWALPSLNIRKPFFLSAVPPAKTVRPLNSICIFHTSVDIVASVSPIDLIVSCFRCNDIAVLIESFFPNIGNRLIGLYEVGSVGSFLGFVNSSTSPYFNCSGKYPSDLHALNRFNKIVGGVFKSFQYVTVNSMRARCFYLWCGSY
ncbi:hypothetical protein CEXT_663471 [Caerostris extrusa]|uniref:Uncharacterized protein n=1 Tax=Caerostris extrusa TaxID=172846 RepID=A0AAV4Y968_CAEEX|nr:hypothetical protein CEXT_663471 [Caerostris extrusa]